MKEKKEKNKLNDIAKRMQTLDTFFKNTEIKNSEILRSSPSLSPNITQNPFSSDNLYIHLEEISQQCSLTKSVKKNKELFTYDYLRCLSIQRFIQLLLNG